MAAAGFGFVSRPIPGRANEVLALEGAVRALAGGRSGVVVVTGAAGMGKSRLVGHAIALAGCKGSRPLRL